MSREYRTGCALVLLVCFAGSPGFAADCFECYLVTFKVDYFYEYSPAALADVSRGSRGSSPLCETPSRQPPTVTTGSEEHPLIFVLTDVRDNDYTFEVTLRDEFDAAYDQTVVIVTQGSSSEFRVSREGVQVTGVIAIGFMEEVAE